MMKIKGGEAMKDHNNWSEAKKFYVSAINELVEDSNDINLLDLIYQILVKSEPVEKEA